MENNILKELEQILIARKNAKDTKSYTASLYSGGLDLILKKIGEETTEVVMASKDKNKDKIISEITDLWFHCMVLLAYNDISIKEIENEFSKRFGISGLTEKLNRNK